MAEVEEHFKRARELGVRYIAITEHHVMDSFESVLECTTCYPEVTAILLSEITVTTSVGGIDLLCNGFPREMTPPLQKLVDFHHDWQRATGAAWSRGLQAIGCDFTDSDRLAPLGTYPPARVIALRENTHVKHGVLSDYCIDQGFTARYRPSSHRFIVSTVLGMACFRWGELTHTPLAISRSFSPATGALTSSSINYWAVFLCKG